MTAAAHHADAVSLLADLSASELQDFKNVYRRSCAAAAGANDAQLDAFSTPEESFNDHYPFYRKRPNGSMDVTYTGKEALTAQISRDGTLRICS
ncbi:hypothetical protein ACFRJ9_21720 [Paenarthrobacter sp. NPDC056912]|uniref:hypothetical protein n=1 Tax=Paenarthrobacter sp. NPDC056912 TaxID=3345965 RepID=UPI00366BB5E6